MNQVECGRNAVWGGCEACLINSHFQSVASVGDPNAAAEPARPIAAVGTDDLSIDRSAPEPLSHSRRRGRTTNTLNRGVGEGVGLCRGWLV